MWSKPNINTTARACVYNSQGLFLHFEVLMRILIWAGALIHKYSHYNLLLNRNAFRWELLRDGRSVDVFDFSRLRIELGTVETV